MEPGRQPRPERRRRRRRGGGSGRGGIGGHQPRLLQRGVALDRGRDHDRRAEHDLRVLRQAVEGGDGPRRQVVRCGDRPQRLAGLHGVRHGRGCGRCRNQQDDQEQQQSARAQDDVVLRVRVRSPSSPAPHAAGNLGARCYDVLQAALHGMLSDLQAADFKLWAQKWRWYERSSLPWNRARLHYEFARRRAFCRWPVHGNVLEMLQEGRLELGEHVLLEPGVWLTAQAPARIRIGGGTLPQPRRAGGGGRARGDRRALHARQRLLRDRRQPPLRRPRQAGAVAGLHDQGPDAARRQRLARRQRGRDQRRDDRRALRRRGELGRHHRPAAVLDRRRSPREGPPHDRVPLAGELPLDEQRVDAVPDGHGERGEGDDGQARRRRPPPSPVPSRAAWVDFPIPSTT